MKLKGFENTQKREKFCEDINQNNDSMLINITSQQYRRQYALIN